MEAGGVAAVEAGDVAAVAPSPLPPQAQTARAVSGITAAVTRKVIGLRRVLCAPSLVRIYIRSERQYSHQVIPSPDPKMSCRGVPS